MAASQKIENQSNSWPSDTTLGHIPKDAQSYLNDTCSTMFIAAAAALFIPGNNLDYLEPKNEERKCGTFTQWNIIQL